MLSLFSASTLFYSFSSMISFSSPHPLLSVHHHHRVSNLCESSRKIKAVSNLDRFIDHGMVDRTSQICSNCNLHHFILHGMVDHTRLIWSGCNLRRFIVCAWLTVPGTSGHKDGYFHNTQHLYGNICKFIVFVCTSTTVPNYSSVLESHFSQQLFTHGPPYCFHMFSS